MSLEGIDFSNCPICIRVEKTVGEHPILKERLSNTELTALINDIQSAVLNNKEVKKTERGINMADEKYVISKASFEDFYETQETLVTIIEKMVDRIELQDQVIMKFGAALTDVMANDPGMAQEMPVDEESDIVEEEVPEEGVSEELGEAEEELEEGEEDLEDVEEEVEEENAGVEPVPGMAPPMMRDNLAVEKSAFEAGYKAAFAEMQKKNGVTVTPLEVPTSASARPVLPAGQAMSKTLDGLSEQELANMTPVQINTWLRENKLYR